MDDDCLNRIKHTLQRLSTIIDGNYPREDKLFAAMAQERLARDINELSVFFNEKGSLLKRMEELKKVDVSPETLKQLELEVDAVNSRLKMFIEKLDRNDYSDMIAKVNKIMSSKKVPVRGRSVAMGKAHWTEISKKAIEGIHGSQKNKPS